MGERKPVRKYIDLDLSIERNPGGPGYRVQAWLSAGGVATHIFEYPFAEGQLKELRSAASGTSARDLKPQTAGTVQLDELGETLYKAVFGGGVLGFFASSLATLKQDQGLRLRLHTSPEVSEWPWELLRDHGGFLCKSEKVSVVRYPDIPVVVTPYRGPRPLRVLVVISNPVDRSTLDVDREWNEIRRALSWWRTRGRVQVERLETPTLAALMNCLRRKRYHALHFIGHGTFDVAQGLGMLLFEDEQRRSVPIAGGTLAGLLGGHPSMRLVVLNACEGARTEGFSGVAQKLLLAGVPAVIAMQYPIADDAAIAFARSFYEAIAKEMPVDRAVFEARESMFVLGEGREIDWAVPVLFLQSPDGLLFDWTWPWRLISGGLAALMLAVLLGVWLSWPAATDPSPPMAVGRPCKSPEGLDMELVYIPAGEFLMGSEGHEEDERPVHRVTISRPFCVGRYEVTQKQWQTVMGANRVKSKFQGDDLPVTSMTWMQGQEFIRKLNEREGRDVYRFLTEAEWEYIAGSPGGDSNCLHQHAGRPEPPGSLQPNELGVEGMFGNVWEWVGDWYGDYPEGPATDPTGPETGTKKVKRGGAFNADASKHCRATARNSQDPDGRDGELGLRIARDIP